MNLGGYSEDEQTKSIISLVKVIAEIKETAWRKEIVGIIYLVIYFVRPHPQITLPESHWTGEQLTAEVFGMRNVSMPKWVTNRTMLHLACFLHSPTELWEVLHLSRLSESLRKDVSGSGRYYIAWRNCCLCHASLHRVISQYTFTAQRDWCVMILCSITGSSETYRLTVFEVNRLLSLSCQF